MSAPNHSQIAPLRIRRSDGSELLLDDSRCAVMGIINLTSDSFSDGGAFTDPDAAIARAESLLQEGADILDLGAESTRPGAALLPASDEWRRLSPVLERLAARKLPVVLSVDTRRADVAQRAAALGVRVLNLTFPQHLVAPVPPDPADAALALPERRRLLASFDAVILMHSRGTPATMKQQTDYADNLCQTVVDELRCTLSSLAGLAGDPDSMLRSRLIFDPGLGFAKTAEQSLELLARLRWLRSAWGGRLLIGASRKSMLGAITGLKVSERLVPSTVAAALAAYQGADVVRVHDVAATVAAVRLATALRLAGPSNGQVNGQLSGQTGGEQVGESE